MLLSLQYDYPNEWHRFIFEPNSNLTLEILNEHLPYWTKVLKLDKSLEVSLYTIKNDKELITLPKLTLVKQENGNWQKVFKTEINDDKIILDKLRPLGNQTIFMFVKFSN